MELVASTLGLNADRGSAGQTLLRIKAVGDYVDRFDSFQRRDIRRYPGQLHIGGSSSVDARVVRTPAGAVYVEGEPSGRIGRDGVCVAGRGEARQRSEDL